MNYYIVFYSILCYFVIAYLNMTPGLAVREAPAETAGPAGQRQATAAEARA